MNFVATSKLNQYYMGNMMTLMDLGIFDVEYDTRQKWIK
jgi:hypothetical protein